jgi:hypothetical protein
MFEVNKHKVLLKDFHRIVKTRKVFFNDGENDIIYSGYNPFDNRLLCFIMFDDDENEFLRYAHLLVTDKQFSDFVNGTLPMRSILETNQSVFIVDYDYALNEIDYNLVNIDSIPSDFLPFKDSYCPQFIRDSSLDYSVSLRGGLADAHLAEARELAEVGTVFSDFLESASAFVNDLDLSARAYVQAHLAGSFKINFRVELQEPKQLDLLSNDRTKISLFIANYFKYFFNRLPLEKDSVFKDEVVLSEDFVQLSNELASVYEGKYTIPPDGVEQKLIDLISFSASKIEAISFSENFSSLEFAQNVDNGEYMPYGVIDSSFYSSIQNKVFDVSEFEAELIKKIDESPRVYSLQVYSFNNQTGKGGAYFLDSEGSVIKVPLHAKGLKNYKGTDFTKSMDKGEFYKFSGIGEYLEGKLQKVICTV